MPTDDEAAVQAANQAWYIALNAMLNGNPAPFSDVYSHAKDVSYMSAEGGLRVGWDATWSDWQAQAGLARGGHVEEIENHTIVKGDMASIEDIDAPLFKSRATIQDGYLKVVSYATEFNEKRGVYATNYNLRRS
jgi:hypothetical protein